MAANKNNFDFTAYNNLMKGVGTGLKLHLGLQMLKDVYQSLDYFDNPLAEELHPMLTDLKAFHNTYKEASKKIQAAKENESERTASIDNSTVPTVGVQDMTMMFTMFQKMMEAQKAGNDIAAQNAATSIQQIGDGVLHQQGDAIAA